MKRETAWDVSDDRRLQYERLQVWMATQGSNGSSVRVILVTACRRGSGTTTTVAGLAAALAERPPARVLVVDANLRAPGLDRIYGGNNASGLSEILTNTSRGGELPVQQTRRPNLFLLATGTRSRSPGEVFERSAIERLVAQLRSRFDFVVLDAPPLLEFPDAYALAPHVDAVLLVLDAEQTSIDEARRSMRDLERAGARPAGIVLNRQRDYTPRLLRRFVG